MQFDFDRFSRIAARVYRERNPYSLAECLEVFRMYFQAYEEYMRHPHPPIRAEQINRIVQIMPFFELPDPEMVRWIRESVKPDYNPGPNIDPSIYPLLIQLHFKTRYQHCDYNINHFFSGRIRELRLHEADAGYE